MKSAIAITLALTMLMPQQLLAQAPARPRSATPAQQAIAPDLARYTDDVLFGDVWLRPGLSPRDRSLLSVTVLTVRGSAGPLEGHLGRALNNGVKPREIVGLITQLAFYSGWPNASTATNLALKVFDERGIDKTTLATPLSPLKPAAAADPYRERLVAELGTVAPKLAEVTDKYMFNDLWLRSDLAVRDRCLVTLAALIASGATDDLVTYHNLCRANGLTDAETGEVLTHLAFYAGWPNVISAARLLKPERPAAGGGATTGPATVFKAGPNLPGAPSPNFTGLMKGSPPFALVGNDKLRSSGVTFQPGARTKWHSHPHGQLLIVTEGTGWVQSHGSPVLRVTSGDAIWTPPGVRHWHGATRTTQMTHVAVSQRDDTTEVSWQEPVSEAQYNGPR